MEIMNIPGPGTFQFSAIRPDELAEEEYTIVNIVEDVSPSTEGIRVDACKARKKIVEACKKSPRADKLLLRFVMFGSNLVEVHGYKPLADIDVTDYKPEDTIGSSTALFDAMYDGVASSIQYAEMLDNQQDINSNGIVFVITDGMNNAGSMGPESIKEKIAQAKHDESIESLKTILIGLHDPDDTFSDAVKRALMAFEVDAELDQYVEVGEATPQKLAKLAEFVSQSISSQSQALGTGGASVNLTF